MIWPTPIAFVNGRIVAASGLASSLRFSSRVLSIGEPPRNGDLVVDLQGSFVLPGLVNAHDHLELNHFGRLKCRDRYANASEWIADLGPRLTADPTIRRGRAHPLIERVFIGGLKNLLAGVTTVAHHNPYYREMRRTMPVRVIRRYGWAHSFLLEQEPAGARGEPGGEIGARFRSTPIDAPFVVHLAEGVDGTARGELPRLESIGCLAGNTVIVHGIAIDGNGWRRAARAGAGLVWCPSSNDFLFGQTAMVRELLDLDSQERCHVALGTDSRVTGERDLLDEMRVARRLLDISPSELLYMVTTAAAALLRQPRAGRLAYGVPADLIVVPALAADPASAVLEAERRDLRLVVVGGRPLVGDPDLMSIFDARRVKARPFIVDQAPKLGESGLLRRIAGCPITEPGISVR
ncbi:MAG TPA: amidohydrolase family protein [Vicinamibacterales bacterium]|jgi:cytosine/adenosine deaminase-related metal-dependent hydrolase